MSKIQTQQLQKEIDTSEITQAITEMKNGKSPGVDGIPIEFYKKFIEILKKDLQSVFNNVLFTLKRTPKTWNNAIICLIRKRKDKLEYLKY